jgi:hypothetical protein
LFITSAYHNTEKEKQPKDKETRDPIQQENIFSKLTQQRKIKLKGYSNINKCDKKS